MQREVAVVGVNGDCCGVAVMVAKIRVSCEMGEMMTWQCLIGADKFARIMTHVSIWLA